MAPGTDNGTIAFMKAHVDDMVYSSVQIEGIASTLAQTREILERGRSEGVSPDAMVKILGIKHGLEYLFDNYDKPLSWGLYSTYNKLVGEGSVIKAGKMRGPGEVFEGDFIPTDNISEGLFYRLMDTAVESASTHSETATTMFLLLCKSQFFYDGNKRSAQMLTNHWLAHVDAGASLVVDEGRRDDVLDLLVRFYEGGVSLCDAAWDLEDVVIKKSRVDSESVGGPKSFCTPRLDELAGLESPRLDGPRGSSRSQGYSR